VPELVGVDHGPDRLHHAVGDVEREHVDHPAFRVAGHRARLPVHPGQLAVGTEHLPAAEQAEHEPCHPLRPGKRLRQRLALAAAVADHDHVGREQLEQRGQVAARGGGEEPAGHLVALLAGCLEPGLALVDVLPGAGEDLTAVRLGLADDARYLRVFIAEHLVQEKHRTLVRREALQQHQEGHGQ
jgi:hypothetical protein